jgi:hypothetical protein
MERKRGTVQGSDHYGFAVHQISGEINERARYFFHTRTDGNKFKARAMDGFMETCIGLQETNSDSSVSDCKKQILTTVYRTARNKF